jgi:tRNA A-37 threonylcarbamoyl transferase component Bud32
MTVAFMELDIEDFQALENYLRGHGYAGRRETIACERLTGGVSNKTVKVTLQSGTAWVLKQALQKLRVSGDWFSDPRRIQVETNGLRWLNRIAPCGATPAFLWEDRENYLMAMELIPHGHENWKSLLLAGKINTTHFEQFGALLGTIHRRSAEIAEQVYPVFESTVYFETLRLGPYYVYTAEKIAAAAGFLNTLVEETGANRLSLVHGDFSPKNTLVYQGRLIILDYEVIHFGDPAFDLGFALTHFLSKAHHLPEHRDVLVNAAQFFYRAYYEEISTMSWACDVEARAVRHTLACLLARVAGKSPLEYLSREESARQLGAVLTMMAAPPCSIANLVDEFIRKIA